MRAVPPSPTTNSSIWLSVLATGLEMTRTGLVGGVGANVPSAFSVPATRVGGTRTPPLAMVWNTPAVCMALTARPWPYITV